MFRFLMVSLLIAASGVSHAGDRLASPDGATVSFANIADGDAVPLVFTVRFSISGMGIAPAGTAIDNTGHFHLLIDVEDLPDFDQPLPATEQVLHFGGGESETELRLEEGTHTLQLLLADYRHVPHEPPVLSEIITVTASPDAPLPETAPEN